MARSGRPKPRTACSMPAASMSMTSAAPSSARNSALRRAVNANSSPESRVPSRCATPTNKPRSQRSDSSLTVWPGSSCARSGLESHSSPGRIRSAPHRASCLSTRDATKRSPGCRSSTRAPPTPRESTTSASCQRSSAACAASAPITCPTPACTSARLPEPPSWKAKPPTSFVAAVQPSGRARMASASQSIATTSNTRRGRNIGSVVGVDAPARPSLYAFSTCLAT
mmetsp:Transcript_35063/g.110817  ORF Transcript_35063/g.110817 Transcript_35063/m.110817 type:complete len:226 (-) Transcript_35063:396-1073(-)